VKNFSALAVVALVVTTASLNSLHNGLLLDDWDIVQRNPHFVSPGQWLKIFMPSQRPARLATYRPVRELTFAMDGAIWEELAAGRHLSSLVVYVGVIVMLWVVARRVGLARSTTFVAICWFGLHAAHSETLCWLKNRGELLSTLFGLGSLVFCFAGRPALAIAAAVCLVAAMGSMETAVVFAGVALAGAMLAEPDGRRRRLVSATMLAVAAAAFVLVQKGVLSQTAGRVNTPTVALLSSPGVVLELAGRYCHLLVVPHRLCMDTMAGSGPTAAQMAAVVVVGVVLAVGFGRNRRAYPVALALLPLGLASIVAVHDRPVAEHRAFAASAGLALCIGLLAQGARRSRLRLAVLLSGTCALAGLFVERNFAWRTDTIVWRDNVVKSPRSAKARMNFAYTSARLGLLRRAERNLVSAIRAYPGHDRYLNILPPEAALQDALGRVRGLLKVQGQ